MLLMIGALFLVSSMQASDFMGYPSYDRCFEQLISALGEGGDE